MDKSSFDIYGVFLSILSQKKRILVHFFLISIASVIFSMTLTKVYKSNVVFMPPGSEGGGMLSLLGGGYADLLSGSRLTKRQFASLLSSRELREKVIKEYDLTNVYKTSKTVNPMDRALKKLGKNISSVVEEEGALGMTQVISVSVEVLDRSPKRASDIANYLYKLMEEKSIELQISEFSKVKEYLNSQIVIEEERLAQSQEKLSEFKIKNKAYNISSQVNYVLQVVSQYRAEILALEKEREVLSMNNGNLFSSIRIINKKIDILEKKLVEMETNDKSDIFIGLTNSLNLSNVLQILEKDVMTYRTLVEMLRDQLAHTEVKEQKSYTNVYLVDKARPAEYKSKPKRALVVLAIVFTYMTSFLLYLVLKFLYNNLGVYHPERKRKLDDLLRSLKSW